MAVGLYTLLRVTCIYYCCLTLNIYSTNTFCKKWIGHDDCALSAIPSIVANSFDRWQILDDGHQRAECVRLFPTLAAEWEAKKKKKWYKRVKESAVNVKLLPFEVLLGAAAWLLAAAGFVTLSSIFLFRASYSHQGQKGLEQVRSRHVLCMWHSIEILYSAAAEYLLVHRNGAARVFFYLFSLSRFLCISRRVLNLKNTKFDASCIHIVWSYSLSVVWTQFHDLKGKIQKLREKWWNIHLLRGSHTTLKCHDESAIYYPKYPSLAVIMNRETQRRERERE